MAVSGAGVSSEHLALVMEAEGNADAAVRDLGNQVQAAADKAVAASQRTAQAAMREKAAQKDLEAELRRRVVTAIQMHSKMDASSQASIVAVEKEIAAANALAEQMGATGAMVSALGKVEAQLADTVKIAAAEAETAAYKEAAARDRVVAAAARQEKQVFQTASRTRQAAQTAGQMATSVAMMGGSMQSAGMMAAALAGQIAMVTRSTRVMLGATGIGVAAVVIGGMIQKMRELKQAASQAAQQRFDANVGGLDLVQQRAVLATMQKQTDEMMRQVEATRFGSAARDRAAEQHREHLRRIEVVYAQMLEGETALAKQQREQNIQREAALRNAERELHTDTIAFARGEQHAEVLRARAYDEHHARRSSILLAEQEARTRGTTIPQTERLLELERQRYALTKERILAEQIQAGLERDLERAQAGMKPREGFARDNSFAEHIVEQGRILDAMHQQAIERYGADSAEAEKAEIRKRAFMKQTARDAMANGNTITKVLLESGSKQMRAFGHVADTMRRLIIGAQAAQAGVEAAIEGGRSVAALARGDFMGAALHAAAALELGAAAALGAQESLGGGGGRTSGGAGGGAGATFSPGGAGGEGGGAVTINIITQRYPNADDIQTVMYETERARIFNRPLNVAAPSTSGVNVTAS